jgi:hypothetical protein
MTHPRSSTPPPIPATADRRSTAADHLDELSERLAGLWAESIALGDLWDADGLAQASHALSRAAGQLRSPRIGAPPASPATVEGPRPLPS